MAGKSPTPTIRSPKTPANSEFSIVEEGGVSINSQIPVANGIIYPTKATKWPSPSQEPKMKPVSLPVNTHKIIAELLGTFVIVYAGCGSGLVNQRGSGNILTLVGMAVVWGLVVMVMIYTLGHVSGGHFNPAVTIALASSKKFPWKQVPAYILAQVVGSTLASLVLHSLFSKDGMGPALTQPHDSTSPLDTIIWEFFITFILMFVVSGVTTDERAVSELSGVAVGATVLFNVLIAGPVTGASMNPARSIGPAIVAKKFHLIWIYIFAPVLGAVTASGIYSILRMLEKSSKEALDSV